jgi:integrase
LPEFGDAPIADLTPRHLDEWYLKLATGEGRDRPLKPTSIRRHHAVLSASLSQVVRWGCLDRNPAERAQPPSLGYVELEVPTVEDVQALLSREAQRNERWGMLLSLAVVTGARRGELCAFFETGPQFLTILRRQRDDAAGFGQDDRTQLLDGLLDGIDGTS